MKKYILALDEGTTSARAILFNQQCEIVCVSQHEFTQRFPNPGWVEHDPLEIYASQYAAMTECIAKSNIDPSEIAAIGITNQRETTVVWNKHTGKPVYNAIVWQCRRTSSICDELIQNGMSDKIREKTGLKIDAYFSGTKIKWILDNVEGARAEAEKGNLLFGTIDTWLLWKLTGGKVHATDYTNASRTMLFNIGDGQWDEELLTLLNIPSSMLPEVRSSSEIYGESNIMGTTIPISGICGDQQSALYGQGCFHFGEAKNTYGTGCFLLANIGNNKILSQNGLVTTLAATKKGEPLQYAIEGSVFVGGAVIQWVRDELRFISDSADSEYFAKKVKSTEGVYVVPAFTGLGAPYWDMNARGIIVGLTRGTGKNHIIRAALESIAYQSDDLLKAIEKDLNHNLLSLRVDGGASKNEFLMQYQSDISNIRIEQSGTSEATAQGVAFLAGLAVGFFKSENELSKIVSCKKIFVPSMESEERKKALNGWHKAVQACRNYS